MKPILVLIPVLYCSVSFAQRGVPSSSVVTMSTMSTPGGNEAFDHGLGINLNSPQYYDVNGSPFLKADFTKAFIAFKNGKKFANVPIKFDILHNQIDIEDKEMLLYLEGIDSLSCPDSIYQTLILKTGYPSINKHDTSSFYQIVAQNDKVQLLKYYYCFISKIKTLGLPDKTSFDIDDQYYLYNKATKSLKEVKLNKKSLSSALADIGYSKADMDKNVDFKNEKEVAGLINGQGHE